MITDNRYRYSSRLRSVWSSKYFDWIVTQMNELNEVSIGVRSEKRFREALEGMGVTPPSSRTMKEVMKELVAERLLIRIGWGHYKVNPLISWRGPDSKRRQDVKELTSAGVILQANVEGTPQSTEKVQLPALPSSRDESLQENIVKEELQQEGPQNTDSE